MTIWGWVLVVFGIVWLGQLMTAISPKASAKFGFSEPRADVDSTFFLDIKAEAFWDALIFWTLPAAGLLIILNDDRWPYLGLLGGGIWLYSAGRGISQRVVMRRGGVHIGKPGYVKAAAIACSLWGAVAMITIVVSAMALQPTPPI